MDIKTILDAFNHHFTLFVVFPLIIGFGLYLTIRLRGIQISHLKLSCSLLTKTNSDKQGNISRFEAISAVLAGNFGTGNISGMAVAIAVGGPGALVWMWLMAFFGAVIQYASCFLGVAYRVKTKGNEYAGGPMYYLREGLGRRGLAVLFSIFTIIGAITVGNFAQINSVVLPLAKMGLDPLYCSLVIALFVGVVILGGIQRIASLASFIVPFKAVLYLGTACLVLGLNYEQVIPAIGLMFRSAFDLSSLLGGVAGIGILKAITTGFDRGLFATDAGTGMVPILQASARSENPVMDGIATLIAPLMVMIVCTITGLVLIVTGAWQEPGLQSTNMVIHAFTYGLGTPVGGYIVVAALVMFAYTTILAWAYCGEKALEFIVGSEKVRWFRWIYLALIPIGSVADVGLIWILADIAITLMLVANLIGIIGLADQVIHASRQFKEEQQEPVLQTNCG